MPTPVSPLEIAVVARTVSRRPSLRRAVAKIKIAIPERELQKYSLKCGSSPALSNVRSSFASLESSQQGNEGDGMKFLVRVGERFKFRVPIRTVPTNSSKRHYVKLVSGQPIPPFLRADLSGLQTKGTLEISGAGLAYRCPDVQKGEGCSAPYEHHDDRSLSVTWKTKSSGYCDTHKASRIWPDGTEKGHHQACQNVLWKINVRLTALHQALNACMR